MLTQGLKYREDINDVLWDTLLFNICLTCQTNQKNWFCYEYCVVFNFEKKYFKVTVTVETPYCTNLI